MNEPLESDVDPSRRRRHRRAIGKELLAGFVVALALVVLYFTSPLDLLATWPTWAVLTGGLVILAIVTVTQIRSIFQTQTPAARAAGALMQTVPFFLLLFAGEYYVLSQVTPSAFTEAPLTRLDTLYFTVTVFTTVGFGDIAPVGQSMRGLVTVQMLLDLILIGAVVKVVFGAVQEVRNKRPKGATPSHPSVESGQDAGTAGDPGSPSAS